MAEFLVELYVPNSDASAVAAEAERARRAADELSVEGATIRYVRSIFVPDEETCFFLFEAESSSVVSEAARRAALRFERVAHAVTTTATPKGAQE